MNSSITKYLVNLQKLPWRDLIETTVLKIVLGNEACDLDSSVCALAYAHLLQSLDKKMEFGIVVPVLNIQREDFPLRTEVSHWLNKFSITEDLLLFRDDIDLPAIGSSGNLHLYIIDHNMLSPNDASLEPFVVSVLDHHQLERTDTPVYGMVVEPVGSCATLVATEYISRQPELLDKDIATLLYGTILLDTVNLDECAKRATPKDVDMIQHLEKLLNCDKAQRKIIFDELVDAKTDISRLNSEQIFRKDMKVVSGSNICVAIASVPLLAQNYLQRDDVDNVLYSVCETFGYDIIVLMGIVVREGVRRDLAVVSHRKALRRELASYLTTARSGVLQLEAIEECANRDCCSFDQGNKAASRKVVLPIIKEWMNSKM